MDKPERLQAASQQNVTEVAAAVLQQPGGPFLLAQRPAGKAYAGYWEFPGGKVETGETPRDALVREIKEELGITVDTAYPWITRVFSYPHATVRLNFFRVTAWHGELHSHEGQQLAWQQPLSVSKGRCEATGSPPASRLREREEEKRPSLASPMLPANAPILRALELPPLYAISNAAGLSVKEFMHRLECALQNGLRLVQVREKNLPHAEMRALSLHVVKLAHAHGARVLINGDIELAMETGADGVHLNSAQLAACGTRPDLPWCAASCHHADDLQRAEEIGLDFAVLGPVLPTQSHPEAAPLGWVAFGKIATGSAIPVYALGGLRCEDMETAWQHGAHGIALLRHAW